ncbi:hypothetical protein [uncultured Maribacter sp.]|uniref:hypothetical protein n=1 Tax=uncultured Maribacter sp. TaxID=431308 RepID=UPI002626140C|nr:hypothetical protein [uncultured Maribacter sp.]
MITKKFNRKHFVVITLLTSIWINISEVFRYFVFVKPRIKSFFDYKQGVADMDLGIFAIWGFWDTLLTGFLVFVFWLYSRVFRSSNWSVFISGTIVWSAVFVIFWVATANMGLSEWKILWITLPLSWLEMTIGAWIASKLYKKYENDEM